MKIRIISGKIRINGTEYHQNDIIEKSLIIPVIIYSIENSSIEIEFTEKIMVLLETMYNNEEFSERRTLIDGVPKKRMPINSKKNEVLIITEINENNDNIENLKISQRLELIEKNYITKETLDKAMRDFIMGPLKNEINKSIEEAFSRIGLKNGSAAKDIEDLRDLISSWRELKREASKTLVSMITKLLLIALLAGIAIKAKVFDIFK